MPDELETTSPEGEPLWHPENTLQRMGDDVGLLSNMIDYFVEDAPDLLSKLSSALNEADSGLATRYAHSLKGLMSNYDATAAVEEAKQVEDLCRKNRPAEAANFIDSLGLKIEQLSSALQAWQVKSRA